MASLRQISKSTTNQSIPVYRDVHTTHDVSMKLDLNSLCIKRPTETFFILVKNPNLLSWGIELDDLVIVEKSSDYFKNDLLVLEQAGDYKFYQYFNDVNGEKILFALDVADRNLRIKEWSEVKIAGVVTNVVHQMRNRFAKFQERKFVA